MSAAAVLRLVRIMQAAPRPGHRAAPDRRSAGGGRAFARLFQFGMRAGMRVWATGQAFWQGDAGRTGATTPSCASRRSAVIAGWKRCRTARRSCRTIRWRRRGCGRRAGAFASGPGRRGRRRTTRRLCRSSCNATRAGWPATCSMCICWARRVPADGAMATGAGHPAVRRRAALCRHAGAGGGVGGGDRRRRGRAGAVLAFSLAWMGRCTARNCLAMRR